MAATPDPYRTLGLAPGASLDEIRRAYRRLAKANHPDSAGEAALPRFLAIQTAYETLVELRARHPGARPGPFRSTPPTETWRADPDRARATRETAGRRAGRSPGAGRANPRPPGATGAAGATGPTGTPSGTAGPTRPRRGDGATKGRSRKRPSNKATLGSTSYDAAEDEPFEPEWSGGTWYGASSGTYWTINPKEYADPRKHGPEYQARARRAAGGAAIPGDREPELGDPAADPDVGDERETVETSTPPRPARVPAAGPPEPPPTAPPLVSALFVETAIPGLRGGFAGRVGLALVGWPPIGVAIATIAGEVTGCGRFAASCVELFGIWTWIAQVVVIAILLAVPAVAGLSAVGTVFALAAAVPTAVFLSATGGGREPGVSGAILAAVLAIAYLGGVAFALARRVVPARIP